MLRVEVLERRDTPTDLAPLALAAVPDSDFPENKPLYVAIEDNYTQGVTYSASSSNPNVAVEIVHSGRTLEIQVSGTGAGNVPISGKLYLRLFENSAPQAISNIITLIQNGYYTNKNFHRLVNDFVLQGGSPNGDGTGVPAGITNAPDEFNREFTFASRGIVGMATLGDDANNAQFFITDPFVVNSGVEEPAPLDRRSQFLNFNNSIIGILTGGFDVYQALMDVPKQLGSDSTISQPINRVNIDGIRIITDETFGVLKVTSLNGFTGAADITVNATGGFVSTNPNIPSGGPSSATRTFRVTAVADTVNDRPFLGEVGTQTVPVGGSTTFTLPYTELNANDSPTFIVGRIVQTANGPVFTTLDATRLTASVDQQGRVTINGVASGTYTVTVGVRDLQDRVGSSLGLNDARNFDTQSITVVVGDGTPPPPLPPATMQNLYAASLSDPKAPATVRVFNPDNTMRFEVHPFGDFRGGASVAMGDVNGDGTPDLVVGAGVGGGPHIKVYDGLTGNLIRSFFAFEEKFTGGVNVAAGDVNGDGNVDIIVAAGSRGGPRVRVFGPLNFPPTAFLTTEQAIANSIIADFFAYDATFRGGVSVAVGDYNGDGVDDIITGAGAGGGPHVKAFSLPSFTPTTGGIIIDDRFILPYSREPQLIANFFVDDPTQRGGVIVTAANYRTDTANDEIFASTANGVFVADFTKPGLSTPLNIRSIQGVTSIAPLFVNNRLVLLAGGDFWTVTQIDPATGEVIDSVQAFPLGFHGVRVAGTDNR